MDVCEPRLTAEDHKVWGAWMRAAAVHARTHWFGRRLDQARRVIGDALDSGSGDWACMVSAGKDSSVLGHLVASMDSSVEWVSEKDDMDYPGEREYVESLAASIGAPVTIVEPPFSVWERFLEIAPTIGAWDDVHGRAADLSAEAFYAVVEGATAGRSILLGLRAEESRNRWRNRRFNGLTYTKKTGQTVCQPLGDWRGLDVYAYAAAHDVPLLPVYQCVALMHRDDPSRVRKSWWYGGSHNADGHVRWLAQYWPSLWNRLVAAMPHARACS